MSYNNDQDPAASTQMFRAFVEGGTPNAPTEASSKSGSSTGKVIGIVVALVVIAAIAYFAMH